MIRRKQNGIGPFMPQYNLYPEEERIIHNGYLNHKGGGCRSCRQQLYREEYSLSEIERASSQPVLYRPFTQQEKVDLRRYFSNEK